MIRTRLVWDRLDSISHSEVLRVAMFGKLLELLRAGCDLQLTAPRRVRVIHHSFLVILGATVLVWESLWLWLSEAMVVDRAPLAPELVQCQADLVQMVQ